MTWLVFDAEYRARYSIGPLGRGGTDPGWVARGDDVAELAEAIGQVLLAATMARFNSLAAAGVDEDFGRGAFAYDRFVGDQRAPHATLRPLAAPYHAVRVLPGCLGTKGGPRTDDRGRVLAADGGGPIPGLYAAGNAAASPFGLAYPGAGATIGPALVFGHRAERRRGFAMRPDDRERQRPRRCCRRGLDD